jgi:UDP-N-acetylmuramate--alanine ligase
MNELNIDNYNHYFFIGIAGAGMSAIAQYLQGIGKTVSGSDRQFDQPEITLVEHQLNTEGISTFKQDGSGIDGNTQICVISTAVEQTNPEIQKALELNIPIVHRADILAAISITKKTIAVSGTSGKSTTSAMIYHIMEQSDKPVSFIGGAGLVALQEKGKIGNAIATNSDWLVIEADESDGTLVKYHPEIGIILNIDKDHKEIEELEAIFDVFKSNTKGKMIVNQSHNRTIKYSQNRVYDFGCDVNCGFNASGFSQDGFNIKFKINNINFEIPTIGQHNMENAAAAVAACFQMGISIEDSAKALKTYKGIYRRHQLLGIANGLTIIDDYAHNPAKLAASIKACQFNNSKLFVWFQPHGYKPTRFLRNDFVSEICQSLREIDEIWMSEIFYAGGTVTKDISAKDLIDDVKKNHQNAYFIENRNELPDKLKGKFKNGDVLLLTGARDPSLADFANHIYLQLINT